MQNVKDQRIYCAEQIYIPEELPLILKNYAKTVIKAQPEDLTDFSAEYFAAEIERRKGSASSLNVLEKPPQKVIRADQSRTAGEAPQCT